MHLLRELSHPCGALPPLMSSGARRTSPSARRSAHIGSFSKYERFASSGARDQCPRWHRRRRACLAGARSRRTRRGWDGSSLQHFCRRSRLSGPALDPASGHLHRAVIPSPALAAINAKGPSWVTSEVQPRHRACPPLPRIRDGGHATQAEWRCPCAHAPPWRHLCCGEISHKGIARSIRHQAIRPSRAGIVCGQRVLDLSISRPTRPRAGDFERLVGQPSASLGAG